jgi:hypothetical protein
MMQATNLGNRYDATRRRLLHFPVRRRVLLQRQVRAAFMIIGQKRFQLAQQRYVVNNDQMVEALPANRPNHPFDVRPLLRYTRRTQHLPNPQVLELLREVATEDPVTVA